MCIRDSSYAARARARAARAHVYTLLSRIDSCDLASRPRRYAHCFGGGFDAAGDAWVSRSCHYRHLCYNRSADADADGGGGGGGDGEWVFFQDPRAPAAALDVALGALNARWSDADRARLRFAPRVVAARGGVPAGAERLEADRSELWLLHHSFNLSLIHI